MFGDVGAIARALSPAVASASLSFQYLIEARWRKALRIPGFTQAVRGSGDQAEAEQVATR